MSFTDLTIGKVHISHSTLVWNKKLQLEIDAIAHTLPFAKLRESSRVDLEMQKYGGNDFSRTIRERFNQAE
jgi:hypothetical protein